VGLWDFLYVLERRAWRRGDVASVGELVAAIWRFATVEPTLPAVHLDQQAPPDPHQAEGVNHLSNRLRAADTARSIAGPRMRRGGRVLPGRRVRAVQRVSASA
jgi:hypothetical protein